MRQLAPAPAALSALLACLLGCQGCPGDDPATQCRPSCAEGFTCQPETNSCLARELPPWPGDQAPGRGARVERAGGQLWIAALAPRARQLVLGQVPEERLGRQDLDLRLLAQDVQAGSARVGITTGAGQLAVTWIGAGGFFHLATRSLERSQGGWRVEIVRAELREEMTPTYRATDDFDIALDASGSANIVFRDRRKGALYRLAQRPQEPGEAWALELIDDGTRAELGACPEATRQVRQLGVGHDPDVLFGQQALYVAYQDADCGDLRLARQGASGRWLISVLDRGAEETAPGQILTGAHPSLALDGAGRPAVAYQELTGARLMYGVLIGDRFEARVVDPGVRIAPTSQRPKKIVGAFARLSFDEAQRPIITYLDATEVDLLRARGRRGPDDELTWTRAVLSSQGLVGFFADHVLIEGGLVGVAERLEIASPKGVDSTLVWVVEEDP